MPSAAVIVHLIDGTYELFRHFYRVKASLHGVSSDYSDAVFYVYVLRSESDSGFYIGFSTNLRARLRQHQNGESFDTSHRGPWKLIYYEA